MIEYKLITVPFLKQKDPFQDMTHEIEHTIEKQKKDGWQFVKMTTNNTQSTRLQNCYNLIFRKNKN
ncbi:DUF4177 domain-containing protein [Turicibacter sanguinis]|uniref:DUF4177 domain-containing protein n=1 Tax=Turicibacter sanguinis TaxID=154288 RepID=UPI003C6F8691